MPFITLYKFGIIQLILSTGLLVTGFAMYFIASDIMSSQIHKNVQIKNDTEHPAYKIWHDPTENSTVYRKYYLFHIENPDELESGKEKKPRLLELGPFVYKEVLSKRDVSFSVDKRTVTYAPISILSFVPELSNGTLQDKVTFFNVPAWGMIESVIKGPHPVLTADLINAFLFAEGTKMFQTKTVEELISGYQDPLLKAAKALGYVTDDTFSLINGKNGTAWTHFTMNTGVENVKDLGKLTAWNGKSKLDLWNNKNADELRGTDGTIYPPGMTKDDVLYAFNPDMCRAYSLEFYKENEFGGVKTFEFHLPKNSFYNVSLNPDNEGFCNGDCIGNGVQNISKCYGGVSSFISQPHFLNADPLFLNMVDGLKPDEEKHDLTLQFVPIAGVPLIGSIKFMISFYFAPNKHITITKNLQPTVIPMIWFDELLELDESTRSQLGTVVFIGEICKYLPIAMMIGGFGGICSAISILIIHLCREKNKKILEEKKPLENGLTNKLFEHSEIEVETMNHEYSINDDQKKVHISS